MGGRGTNCEKLLKLKMGGWAGAGRGVVVASASVRVIMSGGLLLNKKRHFVVGSAFYCGGILPVRLLPRGACRQAVKTVSVFVCFCFFVFFMDSLVIPFQRRFKTVNYTVVFVRQ